MKLRSSPSAGFAPSPAKSAASCTNSACSAGVKVASQPSRNDFSTTKCVPRSLPPAIPATESTAAVIADAMPRPPNLAIAHPTSAPRPQATYPTSYPVKYPSAPQTNAPTAAATRAAAKLVVGMPSVEGPDENVESICFRARGGPPPFGTAQCGSARHPISLFRLAEPKPYSGKPFESGPTHRSGGERSGMLPSGLCLMPRLPLLAVAAASATVACAANSARDFTPEVLALHRIAACGGDALPSGSDAGTGGEHGEELDEAIQHWREEFLAKAGPWFADLFVNGYPASVVYPFGGGDLLTLLGVYPDAAEYTTLSLEGMGDPRPVLDLERGDFEDPAAAEARSKELAELRSVLVEQLRSPWNTTERLSSESEKGGSGALPGVLAMTLLALEVHGYEPVHARFFTVLPDGTLHYLTQADVEAADRAGPPSRMPDQETPRGGPFDDVEITFRARGDAKAPLKVFRHIAADLSDGALEKDPSTLAHLERKGEIAAMTKAASYLLWFEQFSRIRGYLLAHMRLMVSDDTGIPPRFAGAAGFVQEVWGQFEGAYFIDRHVFIQEELKQLWKSSSRGELAFPFGYPDRAGHGHLLFTYKPTPSGS